MSTMESVTTAEQLADLPRGEKRYELVNGELITMTPAGWEHGKVSSRIGRCLAEFVDKHSLGETAGAETGFLIGRDPDTVRAPDAAFVSTIRLVGINGEKGYLPIAPDIAVEVVSPGDRHTAVESKVFHWLDAGTREVWLADPGAPRVTVYRGRQDIRVLEPLDALESPDLLPGFSVRVSELFPQS